MIPTVVVFVANGCGACHEYMPKVKQVAHRYGHHVRVQVVEISDARGAEYARRESIRGTPTTIVHTARGTTVRRVGSLGVPAIKSLFDLALR